MKRLIAAALISLACLSACGQGLLFRNDHRVVITNPKNNATVGEPLEIQWKARDFVPGRNGQFAVFVDRDPMPPGKGIDYFPVLTRSQGIFLLSENHLKIDVFTRRTGVDPAEQDHHDATVVLLDTSGHRIGESGGFVEFKVKR